MLKRLSDWVSLKPQDTALLVIDIQKDFCSPDGFAAKRGRQISKMQKLTRKIEAFAHTLAQKGVFIIFTRFVSGNKITPHNLQISETKEGAVIPCVKGSGGEELYHCTPPKDALIIDKPHYDAFAYTNIRDILKNKNIQNVLITGVRTEICIDATAKRAASEGYNTFILSDLVETYDDKQSIHEYILKSFNAYYGFVVHSENILRELNK